MIGKCIFRPSTRSRISSPAVARLVGWPASRPGLRPSPVAAIAGSCWLPAAVGPGQIARSVRGLDYSPLSDHRLLVGLGRILDVDPACRLHARPSTDATADFALCRPAYGSAARVERAAGRHIDQVGRHAADGHQPLLARLVQPGHRVDQAQRVRVARIGEDLLHGRPSPRHARRT